MHFQATQILHVRFAGPSTFSALAKLHEAPKPCIRKERKGCLVWPLAKHRVQALVRWPCFGTETVDLSQTWFGDQLCADLRAICTVFELFISFGGPLCTDLRTTCIVFQLFISFGIPRGLGSEIRFARTYAQSAQSAQFLSLFISFGRLRGLGTLYY